jgi:hypothetical protein
MQREGWHLDKKVPIGLFAGFVLQTIVIVVWGTTKIDAIDSRIVALEKSDGGQASHENRIVILEQQFNYIRADLAEIKDLLRRQIPSPPQQ